MGQKVGGKNKTKKRTPTKMSKEPVEDSIS